MEISCVNGSKYAFEGVVVKLVSDRIAWGEEYNFGLSCDSFGLQCRVKL